jgi:hypothetical protein
MNLKQCQGRNADDVCEANYHDVVTVSPPYGGPGFFRDLSPAEDRPALRDNFALSAAEIVCQVIGLDWQQSRAKRRIENGTRNPYSMGQDRSEGGPP